MESTRRKFLSFLLATPLTGLLPKKIPAELLLQKTLLNKDKQRPFGLVVVVVHEPAPDDLAPMTLEEAHLCREAVKLESPKFPVGLKFRLVLRVMLQNMSLWQFLSILWRSLVFF